MVPSTLIMSRLFCQTQYLSIAHLLQLLDLVPEVHCFCGAQHRVSILPTLNARRVLSMTFNQAAMFFAKFAQDLLAYALSNDSQMLQLAY